MYSLIVARIAYFFKDYLLLLMKKYGDDKMNTTKAVCNRILQLCEENSITINKLANLSALPPSSVKNILYGKSHNPKILTIKMICDGMGITLGQFFSTSEFDNLEPEVK